MNSEIDMVRSKLNLIDDELHELELDDYEIVGDDKVDMTLDDFAYLADRLGVDYDDYLKQVEGYEWLKTVMV